MINFTNLSRHTDIGSNCYMLDIDGVRIASTPYEGTLEELLRQMKHSASLLLRF